MPLTSSAGSLASAASTEQGGSPHATRPPSLEPPTPPTESRQSVRETPLRRLNSGPSLDGRQEPTQERATPAEDEPSLASTAPADPRPWRKEMSADTLGRESSASAR